MKSAKSWLLFFLPILLFSGAIIYANDHLSHNTVYLFALLAILWVTLCIWIDFPPSKYPSPFRVRFISGCIKLGIHLCLLLSFYLREYVLQQFLSRAEVNDNLPLFPIAGAFLFLLFDFYFTSKHPKA